MGTDLSHRDLVVDLAGVIIDLIRQCNEVASLEFWPIDIVQLAYRPNKYTVGDGRRFAPTDSATYYEGISFMFAAAKGYSVTGYLNPAAPEGLPTFRVSTTSPRTTAKSLKETESHLFFVDSCAKVARQWNAIVNFKFHERLAKFRGLSRRSFEKILSDAIEITNVEREDK